MIDVCVSKDKIGKATADLMRADGRRTMTERDLSYGVRFVLDDTVQRHALFAGEKAMAKFWRSFKANEKKKQTEDQIGDRVASLGKWNDEVGLNRRAARQKAEEDKENARVIRERRAASNKNKKSKR